MNYEQLRQKYDLPELEILSFEFEIDKESEFILREVRRKINERIEAYCDVLSGILQPDASNIIQMHEVAYFDEKEKNKVFKYYRKLMKISRESLEIGLEANEHREAMFINSIFNEWKSIKEQMIEIIKILKESWEKDSQNEEDLRYMG